MTGHIHFGDHLNAQTIAIGHKVLHFFPGVVATFPFILPAGAEMVAGAVGADLMKAGVFRGLFL